MVEEAAVLVIENYQQCFRPEGRVTEGGIHAAQEHFASGHFAGRVTVISCITEISRFHERKKGKRSSGTVLSESTEPAEMAATNLAFRKILGQPPEHRDVRNLIAVD